MVLTVVFTGCSSVTVPASVRKRKAAGERTSIICFSVTSVCSSQGVLRKEDERGGGCEERDREGCEKRGGGCEEREGEGVRREGEGVRRERGRV